MLPIGGVCEKTIAAGVKVKELISPADNHKDYKELSDYIREGLQVHIVDYFSEPLDFSANVYPDLKNTAKNIHMLIAVLVSFQILANATSFGLKVGCLDTFGSQAHGEGGFSGTVNISVKDVFAVVTHVLGSDDA